MPMLGRVGRKGTSGKFWVSVIYLFLILASITTLYPFIIMLSTSVCSAVDFDKFRLFPRFLYDDYELFKKYINDCYGEITEVNNHYKTDFFSYHQMELEIPEITGKGKPTRIKDWREFKQGLDARYWTRCFERDVRKRYLEFLKERFHGEIESLNKSYVEENESFFTVFLPYENPLSRAWEPEGEKWEDWERFRRRLKLEERMVVVSDTLYYDFLKARYRNIEKLNEANKTNYVKFSEIRLPVTYQSDNNKLKSDWETFVRERWTYRYLIIKGGENEYREFLKTKYGNIQGVNEIFHSAYTSFNGIDFPLQLPKDKIIAREWKEFISKHIPIQYLELDTAEREYADFLQKKYGDIKECNIAYGTNYSSFGSVEFPMLVSDFYTFNQRSKRALRWEFLTRNYKDVLEYIALHGSAVSNTLVLVTMTVAGALTIDPLCAYVLSRYRLSYGYKILIFLLATMAFPAEVTMIPGFLLLKKLHLLNTYWALVLPGLANGFHIFLLKGFFDSLPDELYESAMLDGASEMRIFWNITFPMSKPILAVLGLSAFGTAYGGFLWAFIVCPNPKLWTIMVFLYDFQQHSPQFLVMASLVVASLPMLLVFIFCQRIIMQGIIIPAYK